MGSNQDKSVRFVVENGLTFSFVNNRCNRGIKLRRGEGIDVVNDTIEQLEDDQESIISSISKMFHS